MKTKLFTLLAIFGLTCGHAWATGPGRGKGKSSFAGLSIANWTDAGVRVDLSDGQSRIIEPFSSAGFYISFSGNKDRIKVTASLTDDGSVSASHNCSVENGQTTYATITYDGGLSIECLDPGVAPVVSLDARRETGVLVASFGGLAMLLMFGCVLGRAPRRCGDDGTSAAPTCDDSEQ